MRTVVLALALALVGCDSGADVVVTWSAPTDGGTRTASMVDGSVQGPDTPRETKLFVQQRRVDGGIPPEDPAGCACELDDETTTARQDCFEGWCTGCATLDECELTCWWEYEDYMAQ